MAKVIFEVVDRGVKRVFYSDHTYISVAPHNGKSSVFRWMECDGFICRKMKVEPREVMRFGGPVQEAYESWLAKLIVEDGEREVSVQKL